MVGLSTEPVKSAYTVRSRRVVLRRFITWCGDLGLADPVDITRPILERYQRDLFAHRRPNGAPLALGTPFGCLSPLRSRFE